MTTSNAPDWLVELIGSQMRLMRSTPKSIADSVWWEFGHRLELEIKESLDFRNESMRSQVMYRLKEKAQ